MRVAVLMGEHQRGPPSAIHDARGKDSEHAAVPCGIVQDDAVGGKFAVRIAQGLQLEIDDFKCHSFCVAALVVQAVELFGESVGAIGFTCQKEFDDVSSDVHATGGVDARSQAEANFGRCWGAVDWYLSKLHKGTQA